MDLSQTPGSDIGRLEKIGKNKRAASLFGAHIYLSRDEFSPRRKPHESAIYRAENR